MKRSAQVICLFLVMAVGSPLVLAQTRSLEEGPVVRRQLLYRSDRVELLPSLAHSLNDSYRRTMYLLLGVNYHLTNAFSIGVNLGWGALNYNSNLFNEIELVNPTVARSLDLAEPSFVGDFHFQYVPMYGKFNFLQDHTVNYDFHVTLGFGGGMFSAESSELDGFKFGPAFGLGWRFFIDGDTAISVDLMDHMYSVSDFTRPGVIAEERFTHRVMLMAGVSFFVTGRLRVSR